MSIRIMTNVWENSRASGTARLVLLAIADNANDEGISWPSKATIARKTLVSERQVQRIIQDLAAIGELEITRERHGRTTRNVYRVVPVEASSPGHIGSTSTSSPGHIVLVNDEFTRTFDDFHQDIAMSCEPKATKEQKQRKASPCAQTATNSQALVAYFIDRSRLLGSNPPGRVVGHVARLVGELVGEGETTNRVQAGIDLMLERRLHPSSLPSAVHEASLPTPRRRGGLSPEQIMQQAYDLQKEGL